MCSHQCLLRAIYHYALDIYFLDFNTFGEIIHHFSNTFYDFIYYYFYYSTSIVKAVSYDIAIGTYRIFCNKLKEFPHEYVHTLEGLYCMCLSCFAHFYSYFFLFFTKNNTSWCSKVQWLYIICFLILITGWGILPIHSFKIFVMFSYLFDHVYNNWFYVLFEVITMFELPLEPFLSIGFRVLFSLLVCWFLY
jgi:hypothetical protein